VSGTVSSDQTHISENVTGALSGSCGISGTLTGSGLFVATSSPVLPPNPPPPGATTADMILSDGSNGDYEIYDLGNNTILAGYPLGQVGTDYVFGGWAISAAAILPTWCCAAAAAPSRFMTSPPTIRLTGVASLGQVGLECQVGGFAPDPLTILTR
jgi:hypothetical protein